MNNEVENAVVNEELTEQRKLAMEKWKKQEREFDEYLKMQKIGDKLLKVIFITQTLIYAYLLFVRPYYIENIPFTRVDILYDISTFIALEIFVPAILFIPFFQVYENREYWTILIVLLIVTISIATLNTNFKGISKKFITHEDYLEAMEYINVENEAQLAERVEDYEKITSKNKEVYKTLFDEENYKANVEYDKEFNIINLDFNSKDIVAICDVIAKYFLSIIVSAIIFKLFRFIVKCFRRIKEYIKN